MSAPERAGFWSFYKPLAWVRAWGTSSPTIASLWDHLATLYRNRPFLFTEEGLRIDGRLRHAVSYATLRHVIAQCAEALARTGVRPGDRVALWTENRADYAVTLFAVLRLGAVVVPLHHECSEHQVVDLVARARARWLVCDRLVRTSATALSAAELSARAQGAAEAPAAAIDEHAPMAVLFTSGTTGEPKGALLTSRSLLSMRRLFQWAPNPTAEVGLYALPTAHMMALSAILYAAFAGAALEWQPRFDPAAVIRALQRGRPTYFVGVPAMYGKLLHAGIEDVALPSLRFWVSSADVMPPEWLARFTQLGCAVPTPGGERLFGSGFAELFGMVELSGAALVKLTPPAYAPPAHGSRSPRNDDAPWHAAFPLPPYRVRVVGESGEARRGEIGELWIKGPGVTPGYDADAEASARAVGGGWLRTGDLVRRGWWGGVSFAGRQKDVIKHGGYSVFPAQVEAELLRHPQVAEVVVFGGPHPTKGEIPLAAVVLQPRSSVDAAALHQWARERLPPHLAPRAIVISAAEELPRNQNHKLLRAAARERWLEALQQSFPLAFLP